MVNRVCHYRENSLSHESSLQTTSFGVANCFYENNDTKSYHIAMTSIAMVIPHTYPTVTIICQRWIIRFLTYISKHYVLQKGTIPY
jgi:hypothetical protein